MIPMTKVNFLIDGDTLAVLRELSNKSEVSVSEIIRISIDSFIQRVDTGSLWYSETKYIGGNEDD